MVACLSTLLGACATEIVDTTALTTTTIPERIVDTITNLGPLDQANLTELTTTLSVEVELLGNAIFAGDRTSAELHLQRVNQAWGYAEPRIMAELGERADQIVFDLTRVINLARSAVERNRPADASKARSFLRLALQSLEN